MSLEWNSEGVTDGESGESMEEEGETDVGRRETGARLSRRNWEFVPEMR